MASCAFRQVPTLSGFSRRTCRRLSVGCLLVAIALFAASPLSALWSLADAVRHGDVDTLRVGMDWRALRTALKGDLADVIHPPVVKLASARIGAAAAPAVASDDDLPEFGSSFVSSVVSNAVDDEVTPEHLLTLVRPDRASPAAAASSLLGTLHRITGLGFTAPNRFEAAFLMSDQPDAVPVRLVLRIQHWQWKVVSIGLPDPAPVTTPITTADARRT